MLHEFLTANRSELINRCRLKVAQRSAPKATPAELEQGIPIFLDQLVQSLQAEQTRPTPKTESTAGVAAAAKGPKKSKISASAKQHGSDLLKKGFTVDQVVHDYGDLCQAVTELAIEGGTAIETDEFRTLNRCLDDAIAGAVTEYSSRRDHSKADAGTQALNERLGSLAHELRNHLQTAMLAVTAIKAGTVGISGATGAILDNSLIGLRNLIDRSLAEARESAGLPVQRPRISLAAFIAEIKISASLEAQARDCKFTVSEVDKDLAVDADRGMLFSAVGNLLQNAFKFTRPHTEVSLRASGDEDRVLIEVADHCGGLPPGGSEKMFLPFKQGGADKSGLGLGLSICRRGVEANNGTLRARDVPGKGCVFTIDLPRASLQ